MNKSFLAAIILGCALSACSSHPSDFRPNKKVSLDTVPPGSRESDIYNMSGENPEAAHEGHATSHGEGTHTTATESGVENSREDVMLNHDELENDVDAKKVPAEDKTTDASKVENHE